VEQRRDLAVGLGRAAQQQRRLGVVDRTAQLLERHARGLLAARQVGDVQHVRTLARGGDQELGDLIGRGLTQRAATRGADELAVRVDDLRAIAQRGGDLYDDAGEGADR